MIARRLMLMGLLALVVVPVLPAQSLKEKNAWRDKAQSDAKDAAARNARQAAELARSLNGLQITSFFYDGRGWGQVIVQNITDKPASFDFHQVRGLELDTGATTHGADIKFRAEEIASYEVPPKGKRNFKVFFFGGRQIAAVRWDGREDWCAPEGKRYTQAEVPDFLSAARKAAVKQRKENEKANRQLRGLVIK